MKSVLNFFSADEKAISKPVYIRPIAIEQHEVSERDSGGEVTGVVARNFLLAQTFTSSGEFTGEILFGQTQIRSHFERYQHVNEERDLPAKNASESVYRVTYNGKTEATTGRMMHSFSYKRVFDLDEGDKFGDYGHDWKFVDSNGESMV